MRRTFTKYPSNYVRANDGFPFDNYQNIREDLVFLGYDRKYVNDMPLWKLKAIWTNEYYNKDSKR